MKREHATAIKEVWRFYVHRILFPREIEKYSAILDEALEKQIPKKPMKSEREVRYIETFTCPNCQKDFSGRGVSKYCYHCGQRLDWEE